MITVRVNIYALANWVCEEPQPNAALYWHTIECAKEALGPSRIAHMTVDGEGAVRLISPGEGWSAYNVPSSCFRVVR